MADLTHTISIVTPTYLRPAEVIGLLDNLAGQTLLPTEVILVDGACEGESESEEAVARVIADYPFRINYLRKSGGTAIQRNFGIDAANSDLIAFIDDDVRLESDFLEVITARFAEDKTCEIGGIVGYRTNEHFKLNESERWRWYKRLGLLRVFEPGRYDFETGYPINASMQEPFSGTRPVDFMTTACAVWRREVFESGLRFHEFFRDYGVLEDAHLSLRAARNWKLLQCGDAKCIELRSPVGRIGRRKIGYKSVVNYYFVFSEIAGPLSLARKFRFWRYQAFEFFRISTSAIRRRNWGDVLELVGRAEGTVKLLGGIRGLTSKCVW